MGLDQFPLQRRATENIAARLRRDGRRDAGATKKNGYNHPSVSDRANLRAYPGWRGEAFSVEKAEGAGGNACASLLREERLERRLCRAACVNMHASTSPSSVCLSRVFLLINRIGLATGKTSWL